MRNISAAALTQLATKLGGTPINIIAIQWVEGGSIQEYADIDINHEDVTGLDHNIPGRIQLVGGIDNVITVQGTTTGVSGDSQEVSVVFDDIDGAVKQILDQNDIHKRPVWVYQWFDNLDWDDRFLLTKGQVSSPLKWNKRDRTVSFDVINRIEDQEVGFSIEEGNFQQVSADLIDHAWPLGFGTPIHVKTLQTRSPYSSVLQTGFGIHDFTLQPRIDQLEKMCCPLVFRGMDIRLTLGGQTGYAVFAEDPSCYCRREGEIEEMTARLALEKTFEYSTIKIIGGEIYDQERPITLNVCDGALIRGSFTGTNDNPTDTFVITSRTHPQRATAVIPKIKNFVLCGVRDETSGDPFNGGTYSNRDTLLYKPTECGETDTESDDYGWEWYAQFPVEDFFWAEPGCEIFEATNTQLVYIANLLPSTILRVAAYKTFEESGIRRLVTVPSDYYTTRISDFNEYMVTEIVLSEPLSRIDDGFEDDIYVSYESSVGPNTIDIMEWLIDKYTDFTVDSTTFDDVKTKLENYPMDFALTTRDNVLDVLSQLAWQARCALVLRNDVFYIKYLSEEPDVDFTINQSDIIPGTFELSHTDTEDLVTTVVAIWRDDYAKEERVGPYKFNVKYNHPTYGAHREEFDFWAFSHRQLVQKSATFWLIRMANTFRKIKFSTPMHKLQAEVLDCCEVTYDDFAPTPIKCIVESAIYDSAENRIDFELWTPVRSGEQEAFKFAWPAGIQVTDYWPTKDDRLNRIAGGGDSPNVDVEPPGSHPLALPPGFTVNTIDSPCHALGAGEAGPSVGECRNDHGDSQPTDTNDQKPEKKVPGEGEGTTSKRKSPTGKGAQWIKNQYVNDNNQQGQINRNSSSATDGQGEDRFDNDGQGPPNDGEGQKIQDELDQLDPAATSCDGNGCTVTVKIGYINVTAVRKPNGIASSDPGTVGKVIGNQTINNFEYFTFNSLCAAQQFIMRMQTISDSYSATVGGGNWPAPGHASIELDCWSESCEEPEEPSIKGYTNSVGNGNGTAATQDLLDNDREFVDQNGDPEQTANYGPCE